LPYLIYLPFSSHKIFNHLTSNPHSLHSIPLFIAISHHLHHFIPHKFYPSPSLTLLHTFLSFHSIYYLPLFLCMSFLHCNLHQLPMLNPFPLPGLLLGLSLILYPSCYGLPLHWLAPTLACPLHSTWLVAHTLPALP